jgi:large subunit ribosomal protein L4
MDTITLPIYNSEGKEIESAKLDSAVFDGVVNTSAVHQAVNEYRANRRCGLAATKTRGEISGGGKKPWKQKGTGRARVGSTRSPLWRHGGVVFGPHPRDFSYSIPKKIKTLALKSTLNAKAKENSLLIIDELKFDTVKTKEAAKVFVNLKVTSKKAGSILLLLKKSDGKANVALRNIGFLDVASVAETNAYQVLSHTKVIITREGLKDLVSRIKK